MFACLHTFPFLSPALGQQVLGQQEDGEEKAALGSRSPGWGAQQRADLLTCSCPRSGWGWGGGWGVPGPGPRTPARVFLLSLPPPMLAPTCAGGVQAIRLLGNGLPQREATERNAGEKAVGKKRELEQQKCSRVRAWTGSVP